MTAAVSTSPSRLTDAHVALLRERSIPPDIAEAAGLQSVDGTVASKLLGFERPCWSGGLAIPYQGKHVPPYWRVRMDHRRRDDDPRYMCPSRAVPVYIPPPYEAHCPDDLAAVLLVVEAPLKALAMVAAGLSAVGLGGVATTLEKGEPALNPSWAPLNVRGRDVRILFDAGRSTNEKVAAAERKLALALERAGARVTVCALPLHEGQDQGPDDFLARHGAEALYRIVREARPMAHNEPTPPKDYYDDEPAPEPTAEPRRVWTPAERIEQWGKDGPLVHEATGIPRLDELTGGGPVYGSRWYVLGAPDAAKTALLVQLADEWQTRGVAVGFLAVDEEADDLTTRLAQRAKFSRRECEQRGQDTMHELAHAMGKVNVRLYGPEWTIEAAAADLVSHAGASPAALFVDSIQQVICESIIVSEREMGERQVVNANVRAVRAVATRHRMIVIPTSEMNRAAYRSIEAAERTDDMAAGAESRAIEFSSRVMLSLRSVKDHGDLVQLRIVKNKHGPRYPAVEDLFLRIDRPRQTLTPTEAPPEPDAAEVAADRGHARVLADAGAVALALADHPGAVLRPLYAALQASHGSFSKDRADAGLARLGSAVVRVPGPRRALHLYLDGRQLAPDVLAGVALEDRPRLASSVPPSHGTVSDR